MNLAGLAVRLSAFLAIPAFLGFAVPAGAAPVQWTTASGGNGHWYEFVDTTRSCFGGYDCISWNDAVAYSASSSHLGMQGYLATVTSSAEADFLWTSFDGGAGKRGWIGGSDEGDDGIWTWRTGPEAGRKFTVLDFDPPGVGLPQIEFCDPCQWSEFSAIVRDLYRNYLVTSATPYGRDFRTTTVDGWTPGRSMHMGDAIQGYVVEYSAAAPVPEPETYAMMLAGLGLLAVVARRRKHATSA